MIRKYLGYVRIDDDNIGALSIAFCIFPLNSGTEVVFFKHIRIF